MTINRTLAYWICQVGGWGFYLAVSFAVVGVNKGFSGQLLLNYSVSMTIGIGLTHAFRAYAHRYSWINLSLRRLIPRVVGAALLLSLASVGIGDALAYVGAIEVVGVSPEKYWTVPRALLSIFGSAVVMALWLVIYFGVHYFWNFRQAEVDKWKLEAQAETARLKALKLQLNPHFFFNSLNSVRALIDEDPDRAQRMVTRLARLLRTTLQVDDVKTVPLEEELSTVQTYLELEMVRFEDRLQYEIDASDEALDRPVPFLLVQTLVENGIKHGVAERQQGGIITVEADVVDDALRLQVANPGTLTSEEGGVGLQNARERLQLLFGDDASLTLENTDTDTVLATAVLPARASPQRPAVRAAEQAAEALDV